jgi:hypothetical protein
VTRASSLLDASLGRSGRARRPATRLAAGLAALVLVVAACGGGDDDDADTSEGSTPSSGSGVATSTTVARSTTTAAPTTVPPTTISYVTAGATVIVANASHIDGSAGRMSDRLAAAGFTVATPVNSTEGQLEVTKIYYDPDNADAKAVADSLRLALGGGDITVVEVGTPPPIDTGELGDASVIVALGMDTADRTLEELQGVATPATDETDAGETDTGETDTGETDTGDSGETDDDSANTSDEGDTGDTSEASVDESTLDQTGGTGDADI